MHWYYPCKIFKNRFTSTVVPFCWIFNEKKKGGFLFGGGGGQLSWVQQDKWKKFKDAIWNNPTGKIALMARRVHLLKKKNWEEGVAGKLCTGHKHTRFLIYNSLWYKLNIHIYLWKLKWIYCIELKIKRSTGFP